MGGSKDSPKRRFNSVEQKILRCVATAQTADFTQEGDGDRPVISGQFLADLWLGTLPGTSVHPYGIAIKGLRIEGDLSLGGAKVDGSGRDGLVGLMATQCTFDGDLDLGNARIEATYFDDCRFEKFFWMGATEVRGALMFERCRFEAPVGLDGAIIDGTLLFKNCTCSFISMARATVNDVASLSHCRFSQPNLGSNALFAAGLKANGGLKLLRCQFDGAVQIFDAELQWVDFSDCRFRGAHFALILMRSAIARACAMTRIRARGAITTSYLRVGGRLNLQSIVVTDVPAGLIALNLNSLDTQYDLAIERVSLSESLNLAHANVRGGALLKNCRIAPTADLAIDASYLEASYLSLSSVKAFGRAVFNRLNLRGDLGFDSCAFLTGSFRARDRPFITCPEARLNEPRIDLNAAQIGGSATIYQCHVAGQLRARELRIDSSLRIELCCIAGPAGEWSIDASGITVRAIISFSASLLTSGISIPTLCCAELQFDGCRIGPLDAPGYAAVAIWASDMRVSRRVSLSVATVNGQHAGTIRGVTDFSGSSVGESIIIRSVAMSVPPRWFERGLGTVLDLSRTRIGGNLRIADRGYDRADWSDTSELPAKIHGCIVADAATIDGDVVLHRTELRAAGRIARPLTHYEAEERVGKRKRGVALSLRRTVVRGHLDLGEPIIEGICDLRDADIGLIADGSGERWTRAGIRPGHLLLDGLVYRDLDDILDERATAPDTRWRNDAATRRLAWLTLQFPDRTPTADLFVPQPYEQLARIMAAEGNERARRRVLVAKRDLQRRHGQLPVFEQAVGWVLKVTSDYGYSPGRVIAVLVLFILAGTGLAALLDMHGAMVLASTDFVDANRFDPFVYALDAALPIVELDQDSVFAIDATRISARPWVDHAITVAKGLYEILGLILASVTVLTLTGTLRDKD